MAQNAVTSICPRYHHAVELIGRRWNGAIVRVLLDGPSRFAEIAGKVPDISDRMLAERLKELEAEQVVVRTVIPDTPVRVEYSLSERGQALEPTIRALSEWAEEWIPAGH
jgi:DNA-binding HxlR family transcriptional regulator